MTASAPPEPGPQAGVVPRYLRGWTRRCRKKGRANVYGDVRLPSEQASLVREKLDVALTRMREQSEAEAVRQRRRLAKLNEEREKLLYVYYAGAVPIDPLRSEQDRLASETGQAARHWKLLRPPSATSQTPSARRWTCSPAATGLLGRARSPTPPVEPGALRAAGGPWPAHRRRRGSRALRHPRRSQASGAAGRRGCQRNRRFFWRRFK